LQVYLVDDSPISPVLLADQFVRQLFMSVRFMQQNLFRLVFDAQRAALQHHFVIII